MRRVLTSALLVILAACHGVESFPTTPPPTPTPVPATRLTLLVSPAELPIGGGSAVIYIETTDGGQRVAPHVSVALNVDGGSLERDTVVTDTTGHARVGWSGSSSAQVTALAGTLQTSARIAVATPPVIPPPSTPVPPPPPSLPPDPIPGPAPRVLQVDLTADRASAPVHVDILFRVWVNPSTLTPGETVVGYQWDWEDDRTVDATSTSTVLGHGYRTHGLKRARVTAITSSGNQASDTVDVLVTGSS